MNANLLVRLKVLCWLCLGLSGHAQGNWQIISDELLDKGLFSQASNSLAQALLAPGNSPDEKKLLRFEIDRIQRIAQDYNLTEEALFDEVHARVKGVTREEFREWVRQGRFDSRIIEGKRRFMHSSTSNLFFRYPELGARRIPRKESAAYESAVYTTCNTIRKAATTNRRPYVLPKQFRVEMNVEVVKAAAVSGQLIRAWLPIPRSYPFQGEFHLLDSSSPVKSLAPEGSTIRSAYLEQPAGKRKTTEFRILYQYTTQGVSFNIDPHEVQSAPPDPELQPFLAQEPHVVFTPEMRELSRQIVGGEKNPSVQARRIYEWIAANIRYSFALEYSTIRNISEYCRAKGYGDCGQEALLFITLCRLNGVPARWQSGWSTFPNAGTIHDWAEIYLAPYGWLPVDPYMGIWATQYARHLTESQKQEVKAFYFGGLDQYRLIANSAHCQELSPPKTHSRSDTVDFQRGEVETDDRNIYFDQFTYDLSAKEIKLPGTETLQ